MADSNTNDYELTVDEQRALSKSHAAWPLKWLPHTAKPYAELIRLHKPAGIMAFYFPCLYGTFLVGLLRADVTWTSIIVANVKLLILSFFMRCAFVVFNDIVDQDFDRQASRTRIRPLPRRAISTQNAIIWNVCQFVFLYGAFALLSPQCTTCSIPFIILHTIYPLAKRLTHHPQVVLGFAFNHGTFLAFPALGQPLSYRKLDNEMIAVCALTTAIFFWTILYDTIYAAQDIEGDIKSGVGTPVIFWGRSLKTFLRVLGISVISSLVVVSRVIKQSPTSIGHGYIFDSVTLGGTLLGLILMIERVNLKDPSNCGWWFNQGNVFIGYVIGLGLVAEYTRSRF